MYEFILNTSFTRSKDDVVLISSFTRSSSTFMVASAFSTRTDCNALIALRQSPPWNSASREAVWSSDKITVSSAPTLSAMNVSNTHHALTC